MENCQCTEDAAGVGGGSVSAQFQISSCNTVQPAYKVEQHGSEDAYSMTNSTTCSMANHT